MEPHVTQANRRVASDAHREEVHNWATVLLTAFGHDYDLAAERMEEAAMLHPDNRLVQDVTTLLRRRATTVAGLPQRGLHV